MADKKDAEKQEQEAEAQAAPTGDVKPEELSGKTVKLKYSGPSGQVVAGLGTALEEGESYEVPVEMADGLIAGSSWWEK